MTNNNDTQTPRQYLSIAESSELIREQKISPSELVTVCLERIEQLDPTLNAFITVTADQAAEDAERADAEIQSGNWQGSLHGIPVGFKDMYDTAGIRTTAGFSGFVNRVPVRDAEVITTVKEARAIALGKTNMHELAMGTTSVTSHFGTVHNPWNEGYIAGGSSGGSAAAVAAGLCYATIDTDAIGSCRLPAACCGVTGFKPTSGLLSTKGILEGEEADEAIIRLSHTAVMCRTAEDAAILLNELADQYANYSAVPVDSWPDNETAKNTRIGIVTNYAATEEVETVFRNAIETFQSIGAITSDVAVPFDVPSFNIENIEEDRNTISQLLFDDIDALILPTTTELPLRIEEAIEKPPDEFSAENTFFCNYYGLPAITIPCGFSEHGLPIGLQIVGPRNGEENILELAHKYQQVTRWHNQHPMNEH
ncbi:amidase [Haladaptatus halobius]|uniref:amidase n=1 Tax=Haladaptatus halobius TaxID=2884875 RepID=UPI001D0B59AC|nr:amidase [Haladaptatus halobius]